MLKSIKSSHYLLPYNRTLIIVLRKELRHCFNARIPLQFLHFRLLIIWLRFIEQTKEAESSAAEVRFNAAKAVTNVVDERISQKANKSTNFVFCGSILHADKAVVETVPSEPPTVYVKCPMFAWVMVAKHLLNTKRWSLDPCSPMNNVRFGEILIFSVCHSQEDRLTLWHHVELRSCDKVIWVNRPFTFYP
jgi:hypothetical protein